MPSSKDKRAPAVPLDRIRFDGVDIAILRQLQDDSKITNAELARRAGISPAGALERVRKLEQSGVIRGYVARLHPPSVGKTVTALIGVQLREHGEGRVDAFKRAVAGFEEVQCAWHVTGDDDFMLKAVVTDMAEFERFIVHTLSAMENIGRVRTSFCLSTVKDETRIGLDAVGDG